MNSSPTSVSMTEVDYDPFATPELARAVPTTESQREVWLADQLGQEASLAFNESISLTLKGALDLQALQDALLMLSDRHESLRATFSANGMSMLIAPRGTLLAVQVDLGALPHDEQQRALQALRLDAVRLPFNLTDGPLIRGTLARLGDETHELILTAHHIVCDGWSFGVIASELTTCYAAFATGQPVPALAAAESFGDYVLAGLSEAGTKTAEVDERYWVSVYDKSVPVLDLPSDRPRKNVRGFASKREDLRIEPALVEAARRLGAPRGASLFATLFGLFAGLIARVGSEPDVVVGVPAAGQAVEGLDTLVGHCVNLLPVRVLADGSQSVDALLRHARERMLDAYDHQGCTFGRLLSKLHIARDASRLPLVSVQFNIDTAIRPEDLSIGPMSVSLSANPRAFENFDLFVNASQVGGAIVLECQYNTDLFDDTTIRGWLRLYRAAIERASTDAEQSVAALFAATDEDLSLIRGFNATTTEALPGARIETLVARQAAATPDAVAVISEGVALSYRELDHRANAVAHALVQRGLGPGHLVGLACGRNEHLLAGLLGILKSGAAYVPLDPSFPADRLTHMLSDASLAWIVSDSSVKIDGALGSASVLSIDTLNSLEIPPSLAVDARATAYVIYTSGSTGKPKGVVVPQAAVVNFLASMVREPGLTANDRLVAVTTASFDIAVLELLLPLTVGARVILASRDAVLDGAALRALLETNAATVMQATPSGWRLLLDAGWTGGSSFKALVGGEALPHDLAEQLLARSGQLWNMYGPTETTVWSTAWRVPRNVTAISIGTPIANTTIHMLDDRLAPCPIGVPGEIFIGGDGVTDGYLNRPELTAEKFIPDPQRPGHHLYRTGDRGRWRGDGLLEHLGRLDFQVKVRGYRIELGEIETHLMRHAAVDRAVAITREDEPGDVRLVAYVVASSPGVTAHELRDFLRLSLPEYMVPAHVVTVDSVPLLPNGKINRKALPRPVAEGVAHATERVAPRTAAEAQVLAAMEQVLNLPGLSVHDNFFALGGHSLLAAKLTARLNKEFATHVPLRTIFEDSTAERMAKALVSAQASLPTRSHVVERRTDQSEAPLTVMQERIRFMEEMHPGRVVYNTPSAHRLTGALEVATFRHSLEQMVQRQPSLRTRIARGASGWIQRVDDLPSVDLPIEDLSALPAEAREAELMRRMQAIIDRPIPIDTSPLFKAALYRMGPEEHVFLFMPHHIIWDGWSFDLLYQEMSALYSAALQGQPCALPAPPVSYADYAHWHANWMSGEECRTQVQHWKQRFAGIQSPRALPTDRPRRAGMSGAGAVEWVHIDKSLTERLRQVALKQGATLNMLVMAVYAAMVSQAIGGPSLVVGIPVRGRLVAEVESVMGFFNNLLPMHLQIDPGITLPEWIGSVKRELLDAFAHQDVPFERLAVEPEIASHANKAGLYQSLYSFQDARERERHWGPLAHSSVLVMQKGATEDLSLWLMEVPGGLEGGINYNADLFDRSTAELFRERLVSLLKRVADQPLGTLAELIEAPGADTARFGQWRSAAQERSSDAAATTARESLLAPIEPGRAAELTQAELELASLWARLLGLRAEQISKQDNFFDLGGSSLLVMQAVTETERARGRKVDPSRYVYESLSQLTAILDASETRTLASLAGIWAELLGIEPRQIGPGDNFFDLGGNSLLAMRFVAAAEPVLGRRMDAQRLVFETLQQLAASAPSAQAQRQPETVQSPGDSLERGGGTGLLSRVIRRFGGRT